MEKKNCVFIAQSIDGKIADKNDGLDWLHTTVPNPDQKDMGFAEFMERIDALIMGRRTFEVVSGFEGDWPYAKPVYVWSRTLKTIPESLRGKVQIVKGSVSEILDFIHGQGHMRLYIDGGKTIQSFMKEDQIDEMTLFTIPIILGGGVSLFGLLPEALKFSLVESKMHLGAITEHRYRRER